ncbi:metallophosphoesterase [Acetobacter indonesiensis]|uniref:metallophosphoesterase family protein n=1 Tax=Acetobacter indonesiensis TaxID=104101 RepID=UPI000A38DE3B|nr:metallophosphoesterase [Acetobacter indonesiensis]OUI95832.1 metallophosphoesterase [Acetobacter indonesiensis]
MIKHFSRRSFLRNSGVAGLVTATTFSQSPAFALAPQRPPLKPHEPFNFLFITDTHIEPELNAAVGCHDCFVQASKEKADFALHGGDHVYDSMKVSRARSLALRDLYTETAQTLHLPVYNTIGNHDCMGIYNESDVLASDPLYGKKFYQDRFGPTYYSFDHKGVHFIVLDSIGITDDHSYEGRIDEAQLNWLRQDLEHMPVGTPVIVSVHIPLVTAMEDYDAPPKQAPKHMGIRVINAWEVVDLFDHYNVLAVFQGHTHVLETVQWHGVPYITGGAVSGNWWHGTRLGTPEGYMVVQVENGRVTPSYRTYGFQTISPHNT